LKPNNRQYATLAPILRFLWQTLPTIRQCACARLASKSSSKKPFRKKKRSKSWRKILRSM